MSIKAIVKKKGKTRKGRGFSRKELKETGLSLSRALRMGVPVDIRRKTKHEENVEALKPYLTIETEKASRRKKAATPEVTVELAKVKGIGPKLTEKLTKAGVKDANDLAASSPEKIAKTIGVSEKRASTLIENARSLLKR